MSEAKYIASDEWLELWTYASPEGQSEANIHLHWKPTKEAVERLAQAEATNAQLLVVLQHNDEEVYRYLLPLKQGQSYISFWHIGINNLYATIVWSDDPKDPTASRQLINNSEKANAFVEYALSKQRPEVTSLSHQIAAIDNRFSSMNLSDGEEAELLAERARLSELRSAHFDDPYVWMINPQMFHRIGFDHGQSYNLGSVKLSFEVPAEMFGNTKNWGVTRFFGEIFWKNPARDNCQLRQRAIIAAATSPFWVIAGLVIVLIAYLIKYVVGALVIGTLHFLGFRNIQYDTFSLSLYDGPTSAWQGMRPSRWWTREVTTSYSEDSIERTYPEKHWLFLVFNPPVIAAVLLLTLLLNWLIDTPLTTTAQTAVISAVVAAVALFLAWLFAANALGEDVTEEMDKQEMIRSLYRVNENGSPNEPLLRLKFRELKAEVCRPFARNA